MIEIVITQIHHFAGMKSIGPITNRILKNLNRKELVRERVISISREINRSANEIVYDIHGNRDVARKLKDLHGMVKGLHRLVKDHPDLLYSGIASNALQEYAEAAIFYAIVNDSKTPAPAELGIPDIQYLLGLADVIGELRRLTLNLIIEKDLVKAKRYFRVMEKLTEILSKFNYPDSLVPIRRKQDIARGIIEKTQGELAVALAAESMTSP